MGRFVYRKSDATNLSRLNAVRALQAWLLSHAIQCTIKYSLVFDSSYWRWVTEFPCSVVPTEVGERWIGSWTRLICSLIESPVLINKSLFIWAEDRLTHELVCWVKVFVEAILYVVTIWRRGLQLELVDSEAIFRLRNGALNRIFHHWGAKPWTYEITLLVVAWSRKFLFPAKVSLEVAKLLSHWVLVIAAF